MQGTSLTPNFLQELQLQTHTVFTIVPQWYMYTLLTTGQLLFSTCPECPPWVVRVPLATESAPMGPPAAPRFFHPAL